MQKLLVFVKSHTYAYHMVTSPVQFMQFFNQILRDSKKSLTLEHPVRASRRELLLHHRVRYRAYSVLLVSYSLASGFNASAFNTCSAVRTRTVLQRLRNVIEHIPARIRPYANISFLELSNLSRNAFSDDHIRTYAKPRSATCSDGRGKTPVL